MADDEESKKEPVPITKRRRRHEPKSNSLNDSELRNQINANTLTSPRFRGSVSTESPNIILTPPDPDDVVRETRRLSNATPSRSPSNSPRQSPRGSPRGSPSHSRQSSISSLHEDHEHEPDTNHLLLPPTDEEPEEVVNKLIHQRRPSSITVLSQAIRRVFIDKKCKEDAIPAEIIDGLYLGSIGAAKNLEWLKHHGVTHVLCVAGGIGECFPKQFTYKVVDILDAPDVDITAHFESCYEFIEECFENGGKVLVHCFAGMSRSVTVCSAYLMQKQRMKAVSALRFIKERRTVANPNAGFIVQLIKYQKVLGIKRTTPSDLPSASDLELSANEEEEDEKGDKPKDGNNTNSNHSMDHKPKVGSTSKSGRESPKSSSPRQMHKPMVLMKPSLSTTESTDSIKSLNLNDKVNEWDSEERRPSLFTALAKLRGFKKKRAVSTESLNSEASFSLPTFQTTGNQSQPEVCNSAVSVLSLKSVPSGKSMSSTVGPYKPGDAEHLEFDLKQPQTLDEEDEGDEEEEDAQEPPSPLSTAIPSSSTLTDLKNGKLELLKEYGDGDVMIENDDPPPGNITPAPDQPIPNDIPETIPLDGSSASSFPYKGGSDNAEE